MACTAQVLNVAGRLVLPSAEANTAAVPGVPAVASPLLSMLTTEVSVLAQVNGPTVEVISVPLLNALAVNDCVPPEETQPEVEVGLMEIAVTVLWTKMLALALRVLEVAVTEPWKPALPGLQFTKLESNVPAQASTSQPVRPATEQFGVLKVSPELAVNVMVGCLASAVFVLSCACAVNVTTPPGTTEATSGVMVT